jgi:putative DNA primase/helicase
MSNGKILRPQPDRTIAQNFVRVFTGSPDTVIRIRFIHDSDRKNNSTAEREGNFLQLWPDILEYQRRGYAVFYFLNEIKLGPGNGYRGAANDDDVTRIRALATDHDNGLPEDWEWHVQPAIIVRTSRVIVDGRDVQKGQALWPITNLSKVDFKGAQLRLAAYYNTDKSISNPSRVLRLPGTLHLKDPTNPQLVTFDDFTDGKDLRDYMRTPADILADLPPAEEKKLVAPSPASGAPVPRGHLRMVLAYLDPGCPRDEWIKTIAAIRATPVEDDDDESERRQIAHEWSQGLLDNSDPARYTGPEDVDQVFDTMPPKVGGVTYGTIYHAAKMVGYNGPPAQQSVAETFVSQILGPTDADAERAVANQNHGAIALVDPQISDAPVGSEDDFAMYFADKHFRRLRYVAMWKQWLIFDGQCWKEDGTLAVWNGVREMLRAYAAKAKGMKPNERKKIASKPTVVNVETLVRCDRRIAATVEQWDADPWLLNTPSGVVDLRTGNIRETTGEEYLTKMAAVPPGGDCPQWMAFLERVTGGNVELQRFLARMAGYCLTGITKEHAMFFVFGTGGNGKGVFLNTMTHILGDYAKVASVDTFTASNNDRHPTDLAMLRGARLVASQETDEGRHWAEAKLKMLTGGDPVSARFMHKDFFTYVPQFKLVIAGNHKPRLRNVDEAMRRRLHFIPFTVTILEAERDPDLPEKLRPEWSGILQWAIQGCLDWQAGGLLPPKIVQMATFEYFGSQDPLAGWIEERCIEQPDGWAPTADLYSDYCGHASQAREVPEIKNRFSQRLESLGFKPRKRGAGGVRGFEGLVLRPRGGVSMDHFSGAEQIVF